MTRSSRNDAAAATVALCPASFATHLRLFFAYFSSHPAKPHTELGLVHALNNHGAYVFISDAESTSLALLMAAFFAGFLVTLVIVPKEPILPSPATPRWITCFSYAAKTDLANPTLRLKIIFLCSLVIYVGIIYFAGPSIVRLVVSQGIVL